mmetsp:Transcript_1037/g.1378  ORF Transcript_1037/g.1378 Transcript_1037/m.1378 type:complete len:257 (+) Transcript_1037:645-1415(+)
MSFQTARSNHDDEISITGPAAYFPKQQIDVLSILVNGKPYVYKLIELAIRLWDIPFVDFYLGSRNDQAMTLTDDSKLLNSLAQVSAGGTLEIYAKSPNCVQPVQHLAMSVVHVPSTGASLVDYVRAGRIVKKIRFDCSTKAVWWIADVSSGLYQAVMDVSCSGNAQVADLYVGAVGDGTITSQEILATRSNLEDFRNKLVSLLNVKKDNGGNTTSRTFISAMFELSSAKNRFVILGAPGITVIHVKLFYKGPLEPN